MGTGNVDTVGVGAAVDGLAFVNVVANLDFRGGIDLSEVAGEAVTLVAVVDVGAEGVVDEVASGVAAFAFVDLDTVVANHFSSIDADAEESAVIVVAVGISVTCVCSS